VKEDNQEIASMERKYVYLTSQRSLPWYFFYDLHAQVHNYGIEYCLFYLLGEGIPRGMGFVSTSEKKI